MATSSTGMAVPPLAQSKPASTALPAIARPFAGIPSFLGPSSVTTGTT